MSKKNVKSKSKSNIFDLYQKEKVIKHKDDEGREVEILLEKMTQRERADALEKYYETLEKEKEKLRKREKEINYFRNITSPLPKKEIVKGIIQYERVKREQIADLYPTDEKGKKKEEKQKELLANWEKDRVKELKKEDQERLLKEMINISIESSALVESGRIFDNTCLFYICKDKKTKKRTFSSPEEVEAVRDKRVLEWLQKELNNFRKFESQKNIRKAAENESFLQNGESQKK